MKIAYTTIIVRDMDESVSFYTGIMGFEVHSRHNPQPGVMITLLKGPGETMVELIKETVHDAGFYSIGMDVEDLNSTIERLKAGGAKITMEPVSISVGSLAFIEDPNGVRIALIQHS
ncbi:VOC family protein [Brucepastera parasyntrophica]|uniref:VOC family protein n=1 Tax=Brucepastera parasyntrophica TaxID=2880008 RepID=UPI002109C5C8|nr:VOC family protein [Brucepastera parasyntrophica]ULQ58952.1 VOC family protein [Brucepastera parasyntrophica]